MKSMPYKTLCPLCPDCVPLFSLYFNMMPQWTQKTRQKLAGRNTPVVIIASHNYPGRFGRVSAANLDRVFCVHRVLH